MEPETVNNAITLNIADYTIIVVVLLSVVISLVRGFVREAFSLASWGAAIFLSVFFCSDLAELLSTRISTPAVRLLVSFGIIFIVTLIVGAILSYLFVSMVHKSGMSGTDRFLGGVFGLLRGALVVALLVMFGQFTKMPEHEAWEHSVLIPHFQIVANDLKEHAPQIIDWFNKDSESV